ncbi:MAG: hypothetical protein ABIZ80_24280, partial [Bryobacteraceae bacterium]
MVRLLLALVFIAGAMRAEERWIWLKSDGAELITDAGSKAGKEALMRFEQFRFALGKTIGKPGLRTILPARIVLFRTAVDAAKYAGPGVIQQGAERVHFVISTETLPRREFWRDVAALLLDQSTDRMPQQVERGLAALFSTLEVTGIRITLGKPLPVAERDRDWARMHLLAVDEQYYGKMPVLFHNLSKGGDPDPAYRNAFGKSAKEIEADVDRYLAAGNFKTVSPPNRPLSLERDFPERALERDEAPQILMGMTKDAGQRAEYLAVVKSARAEKDEGKAIAALTRAIEMQPKSAEPHFLLAMRQADAVKRIEALKAVLALDRRNAEYWQALAQAHLSLHDYGEASKAWRGAEQASVTDEQRAKMRQARLDIERQRLDFEEGERRRIAEEKEREIRKLKAAAIAELRAIEARVNKQNGPADPDAKVVQWWDGPTPGGKISGTLVQVDCLGTVARLVMQDAAGKITKVVVRDPSKIAIAGGGEQPLGCGKQKPRPVTVEYSPKADPKLATVGEAVTI